MTWLKYFVPAVVGANLVAAQCSFKTSTVSNAPDASALAQKCATVTGTIAIATSVSDPIDLSGIEVIKNGGIYAHNNGKLPSLTGNTLTDIENGQLYLDNVTQLYQLTFPMLTSVSTLHFNSLASLYNWDFTAGIQQADNVQISDTQVNALTGINLKTVNTLFIANNNLLSSIDMQLSNITGGVVISQNSMPEVSFPNLGFAVNMTFVGISGLTLSNVKFINQTLGVYESTLQNVSLPKLTTIGGLALVNSPNLETVSTPNLELVSGALTIANDSMLAGELSFPKLEQVRGAVKLVGSFTSVSMPKVTNVRGAFDVTSHKKLGDTCSPFDKKKDSGVIQGKYTCTASVSSAMPTRTSGSDSGNGGSGTNSGASSSTSTGAAAMMDRSVPMVGGVFGLFLAILGML